MSTNSDLILAKWAEEDEDELTFDPLRGTRADWEDDVYWLSQWNASAYVNDDRGPTVDRREYRLPPDSV